MPQYSIDTSVMNQLGLHARAAAKLVQLASRFQSEIRIVCGEQSVCAKSIMAVLLLAATQGTDLRLEAEGADAKEALEQLQELIESGFGEMVL